MTRNSWIIMATAVLFWSCGGTSEGDKATGDTAQTSPEVPHPVRLGKEATYAHMPDTAMLDLVLGNGALMKNFTHENGAAGDKIDDDRTVNYYYNAKQTELLSVYVKGKGLEVTPYAFRLKKVNEGEEVKTFLPVLINPNIVSGHGVHIGMTRDYLLNVYKGQELMEWQKGDTLYLEFKPKEKDKPQYKRYAHTSYYAKYWLVNDKIRMMEMYVDPAEIK